MAAGLLNVSLVSGSSPNWQLTVTTVGACVAGDHLVATLAGLPVGRGAPYRVASVPDLVTINVVDDLRPGGGVYGTPANGPASFYSPTVNYRLQQLADRAPYWSETSRRDSATLDLALKAIQDQISGSAASPVQSIADLRAIGPTQRQDKQTRLVEDKEAIYAFDVQGIGADDGDGTIVPTDILPPAPGRWFKTQAATQNHENLSGLLGGAPNDHQHLTTAEKASFATDSLVVHKAGDETITGTKTFDTGVPPVITPCTVANLPVTYEDGAIAPVTDDPDSPLYVRKSGAWVPSGGGGDTGKIVTAGSMVFLVDYNDPDAVDPDPDTVFTQQSEIDTFLSDHSATNFKHMMACWKALPPIICHYVDFYLASGVHRPMNPVPFTDLAAWHFHGKMFLFGVSLHIYGASPSTYTPIVASQTIADSSVDPTNPWLDFDGTPFSGEDLRGYFVIMDTGQVTIIHQHTDSRLYVLDELGPTPEVSTCFVGKPSTVLRNSYDDVGYAVSAIVLSFSSDDIKVLYDDLLIESFGAGSTVVENPGVYYPTRVLIDLANEWTEFGQYANATAFSSYGAVEFYAWSLSIRGGVLGGTTPGVNTFYVYAGRHGLTASYLAGSGPVMVEGEDSSFGGANIVYDQMPSGAVVLRGASYECAEWGVGYPSTIRNCGQVIFGNAGIWFAEGARAESWNSGAGSLYFENCAGDCVRLGSGARIEGRELGWAIKFRNGPAGGNSQVGIWVEGPHARLHAVSDTDVSGTSGDVRLSGGDILSYEDIGTNGPYTDMGLNVIQGPV